MRLRTHASAALAASRAGNGLVARREDEWLRLYGTSRDALARAQAIVQAARETEGVDAEEQAEHRNPAGEWVPFELPAATQGDSAAIHEHRGKGPWGAESEPGRVQVHFELGSRSEAKSFAKQLEADGYDVHEAESFLFVFADDAEHAHKLGEQLQARAPAGARLFYEGEGRTAFI